MNQLCVCVFCQTQFSKEVSLEVLIDYIVFKIEDEDQLIVCNIYSKDRDRILQKRNRLLLHS